MDIMLQAGQVLVVIIAFSLLIFVHELGHFLAAIATGVKVERFMLGFDVWGWGLKKKIRGIEFGLGALPLGGYVKLKGQSDLPGEEESTGAPDELISKGVGARLLIFAGGVAMNFLFGFALLVAAQLYGVPRIPAMLGHVIESGPADAAGLQSGDRVLAINGKQVRFFTQMRQEIAMADSDDLTLTVERTSPDGTAQTFQRRVEGMHGIGRGNLRLILTEMPISRKVDSFAPGLPADAAVREAVAPGDRIVAVNGEPLANEYDGGRLYAIARKHPGRSIELTVESPDGEGGWRTKGTVATPVPAVGAYDIGLRYARRVNKVEPGTPAARANLHSGDWIAAVDGTPVSQQDSLTDLIQRAAFGQPLQVTVLRGGERTDVEIRPEAMTDDLRIPVGEDTFLGIRPGASAEHGIPVREVLSDGPAADRLAAGDLIIALDGEPVRTDAPLGHQVAERQTRPIELTLVRNGERSQVAIRPEVRPEVGVARIGIRLGDPRIEGVDPGSIAERLGLGPQDRQFRFELSADLATTTLSWNREGEAERMRTSFPTPAFVREGPVAAGLVGQPPLRLKARFVMDQADGLWAACSAALPDAWEKTTAIYRFIHRLVTRKISPTAMGGPILIFSAMYHSVDVGWGRLLDMAALISINLAVLNLLPIPVLDGGHILFLFIEGITGSRPSARVREYAQYAGFLCLLGLMLMVTAFDLYFHVFQG